MLRLRTQNAKETFKTAEFKLAAHQSEGPAKRAKVVCEDQISFDPPSTAAYSALLAGHSEFESYREPFVLKNQWIPRLDEMAKELQAKIAKI